MGRPKGSKNGTSKQVSDEAKEIEASGDNVTTLPVVRVERFEEPPQMNDAQSQELFFQHQKSVNASLTKLKKAQADFKNVCKLAKSELGKSAVSDIKLANLLETQEGEDEKKAEVERMIQIAAWVGSPLGTQLRMFGAEDGVPLGVKAYEAGRRAGIKGDKAKPPSEFASSEAEQQWLSGHADGNAELATQTFKPFPDSDASRAPSYEVIN